MLPPISAYGRDGGCSITGGYVYQHARLPQVIGAYIYWDFCSGKIWALRHEGTQITEAMQISDTELRIAAFGRDLMGEIFILSFDGEIYRFVA